MPTYRKTTQNSAVKRNTLFNFNVPTTTDCYIDTISNPEFLEVSASPYWEMLYSTYTQSGAGTVTLTNWNQSCFLKIYAVSGDAKIKFNDASTTQIHVSQYTPLTIIPKQRIKNVIVVSGNIVVEEVKNESYTI